MPREPEEGVTAVLTPVRHSLIPKLENPVLPAVSLLVTFLSFLPVTSFWPLRHAGRHGTG